MPNTSFSAEKALSGLKDFQRNTVEYVFSRFYGDNPTSRFLVADEVGLGKTMIAKGIIAKTVEHMQYQSDRIDVIYICSNASIASQNIKRLNVSGEEDGFTIATRLTYLPIQAKQLQKNRVNFISLTPATAFDHARSRGGHADERAIVYRMLHGLPFGHDRRRAELRTGLLNLLQATAGHDSWRNRAKSPNAPELDPGISRAFLKAVLSDKEFYAQLKEGCSRFKRYRPKGVSQEDRELQYALIAKLRNKLASTCVSALTPTLVVVDEFQRFKNLLQGEDDASMLAKTLFKESGARVLLLSATPYKMYTLAHEGDEDNHYQDFIETLKFLFDGSEGVEEIKKYLSAHRLALHSTSDAKAESLQHKRNLERALLRVMCRTERVTTTRDHNSMLREVEKSAPLKATDINNAAAVDQVASLIQARDLIEFWKSSPYLLNFLKHYEFRRKLDARMEFPSDKLYKALLTADKYNLKKADIENYQHLDPANPRMRALFSDTLDKDMWQLLWMPPSMPYMEPAGLYQGKDGLTKALVFSSWNAVPNAIASICSYEAERRMVNDTTLNHSKLYDRFHQLLHFSVSAEGRPTGMPMIAWLFPSTTLAKAVDPLKIALAHGGDKPLDSKIMRQEVRLICEKLIDQLPQPARGGNRIDERWYWAAPILLDAQNNVYNLSSEDWELKSEKGLQEHIALMQNMMAGNIELGLRPNDLVDVLCDLALGGPGTCALRGLMRIATDLNASDQTLLISASRIAVGFRSLFNMPESIALLRQTGDMPYWRLTLQYCIDGNLQSVLDEYVHVLKESLGLQEDSQSDQVAGISKSIHSVLSLRTAQIGIDEIVPTEKGFEPKSFNTRCRFALRFGDIQDDSAQPLVRADTVRDSFNSPFRPFILASTSIGQEGLDFHTWCHAVMHWNLPSNPVDLEQREGRVHRYKGHAVRKNISQKYGLATLAASFNSCDPWQELFSIAAQDKGDGLSDLIPYWIFEDGPARVERRIPILPFSKEAEKLKHLKQGLALYRMVFGQPRQEDLLFSLTQNEEYQNAEVTADWLISLQPPKQFDGLLT